MFVCELKRCGFQSCCSHLTTIYLDFLDKFIKKHDVELVQLDKESLSILFIGNFDEVIMDNLMTK